MLSTNKIVYHNNIIKHGQIRCGQALLNIPPFVRSLPNAPFGSLRGVSSNVFSGGAQNFDFISFKSPLGGMPLSCAGNKCHVLRDMDGSDDTYLSSLETPSGRPVGKSFL